MPSGPAGDGHIFTPSRQDFVPTGFRHDGWRAPVSGAVGGAPYQFKVEGSDSLNISAAILSVLVSGQNVRPECPLTVTNVTASEGDDVLLPLAATDANGDLLRYRAERELVNGRVDSAGYRWDIPYGTVEQGANDRTLDFQWAPSMRRTCSRIAAPHA